MNKILLVFSFYERNINISQVEAKLFKEQISVE